MNGHCGVVCVLQALIPLDLDPPRGVVAGKISSKQQSPRGIGQSLPIEGEQAIGDLQADGLASDIAQHPLHRPSVAELEGQVNPGAGGHETPGIPLESIVVSLRPDRLRRAQLRVPTGLGTHFFPLRPGVGFGPRHGIGFRWRPGR